MLQPLAKLDTMASSLQGQRPSVLLLLLDALDESDDAGRGYAPVTRLIAHE